MVKEILTPIFKFLAATLPIFSSFSPNVDFTIALLPAGIVPMVVMCGYLINVDNIPTYVVPVRWLSWYAHLNELLQARDRRTAPTPVIHTDKPSMRSVYPCSKQINGVVYPSMNFVLSELTNQQPHSTIHIRAQCHLEPLYRLLSI